MLVVGPLFALALALPSLDRPAGPGAAAVLWRAAFVIPIGLHGAATGCLPHGLRCALSAPSPARLRADALGGAVTTLVVAHGVPTALAPGVPARFAGFAASGRLPVLPGRAAVLVALAAVPPHLVPTGWDRR